MKHVETNNNGENNGANIALQLAAEEAGIGRKVDGAMGYLIPTIAVIWSLFQLSVASFLILDTIFIRSIHLGFALLIVFLNYPVFKNKVF